jgi:peptide deformylase
MVQEIIQYPTPLSLEFGAPVRHFDDSLKALVQDLKDTIEANDLTALSAFQIGSSLSVMVVKNEGEYLEIINPVIIKREGTINPTETTAYFPGLSAKTKRYEKIRLGYEDVNGTQQYLSAEGDLAVTIQRKADYLLGANFRLRMTEEEKNLFDNKLEFGTDALDYNDCPTVFKRDRILHLIKYGLIAGVVGLIIGLFFEGENLFLLKTGMQTLMVALLVLLIGYFFYAQYEGKQYKQCTSCQIGNIVGTTAITGFKLLLLFITNYFMLF